MSKSNRTYQLTNDWRGLLTGIVLSPGIILMMGVMLLMIPTMLLCIPGVALGYFLKGYREKEEGS